VSRVENLAPENPGALLTRAVPGSTLLSMDADENLPRRKDDVLIALARQDLDPLSVEELEARVAALEIEIARSRARIERAVNHRASADALFKR
jgi:uncharacterized small protein (DUF1192 family)